MDGGLRKFHPFEIRRQRSTDYSCNDSVIEMHTFLVTLIRKFDFSLPNNGPEMRKMRTIGIIPVLAGEEHKGPQMPLRVSILENE